MEVIGALGQLRLTLFGSPRVERNGDRIRFDTRKATALLAYLAITGRPQRRDVLAAMLWPEAEPVKARSSLRRTLSVASAVGPALVSSREDVAISQPQLSCDVTVFDELLNRGGVANQRAAVELANDDFMAGFTLRDSPRFDDWQSSIGERIRDRLVAALALLVHDDMAHQRDDAALTSTRRWLSADPMSESAHCQAMRLLTWTGQRPLALQQYRKLVRVLDSELGVEPMPETIALYDDIRKDRLVRPVMRRGGAPVSVAHEPQPTSVPIPAIVGRDDERRRLFAAWEASARRGRLLGLVGEPGLGRTALAQDLANRVSEHGGRTGEVRVHGGEQGLPFAAARDLVRLLAHLHFDDDPISVDLRQELIRLDPSLGGPADITAPLHSPGALVRMFDAVRQLVVESLLGEPPGLLVVDDIQWLDPSSADLIAYVVRRLPAGIFVVASWRSGASNALTEMVLDHGDVVALSALTTDGVRELMQADGNTTLDPDDVQKRTSGVPRLVHEHLAAARSGTSASGPMRDLVLARLEAASSTTRQLAGAAAVIGGIVDPELLRATAGRDELETVDALEEAVTRGLLVEAADRHGYDFPHDLLRDIVLQRTSLARQRLLHARAAEALMRRHAANKVASPAAVVARHLAAAGRQEEAASWFWRAACEARDLYAHREELAQLQAAQATGYDPAAVHGAAGGALTKLGRYRQALVSYEQAAASTQEPIALALIEHKLATVHDRLGDWVVAQAHLESAATLLEDKDASALRARVAADIALVLHRQGQAGLADAKAQAAINFAQDSEDPRALAQAHNVLGVIATGRGELQPALDHLTKSMNFALKLKDVSQGVAAANNLARVHELMGNHDDAMAAAERALDLGLRHGDRHRVAALHSNLADLLHRRGADDAAQEHAKQSAAAFADVDDAGLRPQVWTLVEW